jgi:MerR family transcriptional regulator, mercuric resistance operon regulatory protein
MLIADAAGRAGVNPQTLRYYERRGLLRPSARRPSGYREYTPDDVKVVRFVKRAQELGFALDDVEALLALRHVRGPRAAVRAIAERHVAALDRKIDDLQRMRGALATLVGTCHAGTDPECPILEAFESAGEVRDDAR